VTAYLARRVLQAIAVVVLVTLIVFALLEFAPGTARAQIPGAAAHSQFLVQYLGWLGQVVRGNLGSSGPDGQPVSTLFADSLPRTLILTGFSTVLALAVAIPAGIVQAVRPNSAVDYGLRAVTYIFYSLPVFVLGSVLILFLGVDARVFAAVGPQYAGLLQIVTDWRALTLPVLTLALGTVAIFARYMRSAAADSLDEDYVEAARARGADERRVLLRHVLRNSLVPVVTLLGLSIPQILGGALVVESLFNFPGIGWQIWQAAQGRNVPVLLGFTLLLGIGAVLGSLLADIGYALLDPRVRYSRS
jgi:peptide/nickel transport system permease protein